MTTIPPEVRRDERKEYGRTLFNFMTLTSARLRRFRLRASHTVLPLSSARYQVCADFEVTVRRMAAIARAHRFHVDHVLDAVRLLLDQQAATVAMRFTALCTRVACRHLDGERGERSMVSRWAISSQRAGDEELIRIARTFARTRRSMKKFSESWRGRPRLGSPPQQSSSRRQPSSGMRQASMPPTTTPIVFVRPFWITQLADRLSRFDLALLDDISLLTTEQ